MRSLWGHKLQIAVFGASHAPELGVTVDGLPAGLSVDTEALQAFLSRRAPGNGVGRSPRKEPDRILFRSGLEGGVTTGGSVTAVIENRDADPKPYALYRDVPRPSHIDYPARLRFGENVDLSGGGHFSGRMTATYCIAGGIVLQQLEKVGIRIAAHLLSVGDIPDAPFDPVDPDPALLSALKDKPFPVIDDAQGLRMQKAIGAAAERGDSLGGVIECIVTGFPAGYGTPLFSGVDSRLAELLFAVPAVRGVGFGSGFDSAKMTGSAHNDPYYMHNGAVRTETNRHGGILGGITTGMPIVFSAAVKPASGIAIPQKTLNLRTGKQETLLIRGRHDACIAVRAVPVIEAVAALALYDLYLEEQTC